MQRKLILALAPALLCAQPAKLSLKQAVDIALAPEGSTRIQLAEEVVRQSRARSAQARAALLPNLDGQFADQSQTRNLEAFGLQIKLPPALGFSIPTFVGPFTTTDARVSATQSIFDFSSIRRFQASRVGVRAAEAENSNARDQVAGQVATLYMAALAAQAHVEAAQANVDLSQAIAKLAENRKNAGTGTGIEVTRALVLSANDRQRLLVAQNERRQAQLQLMRAMGVNLDTDFELTGKLEYTPAEPVTPKQALEKALSSRADLKAQQTREQNARLSYSATKFERLPSLASFADYGSSGTGFGNSVPTRTYGIALRVPIFDGGRRDARRAESVSQFRQESIRTADLREQVELEIRLALDSLHSAEDQVGVAREGLDQAEREVAQAQRRYEAGVASSIEPTDAQTRLARARDNQISALLGYNVARINLAQATGAIRQIVQ
jgi:outer membrane protein TolC